MTFQDIHYYSQEGLKLYARDYGSRSSPKTPILCLPGLTRNSKDFADLAERLSRDRRVICPDFRGRGKSEYAKGWTDYTPLNEMRDTLDLMAAAGVNHAIIVGTSRGGLVAMNMALHRPTAIKGVVMNDIGPEVDKTGIERIMGYAGKMNVPPTWEDAAIAIRQMNERYFPNMPGEKWHAFARMTFRDDGGKPAMDYDAAIGTGLRRAAKLMRGNIPTMWKEFKALSHVPVLLVRGENSDLLSTATAEKMATEHSNLTLVTAKDRGHAPFLDEPEVTAAIDTFLAKLH
ncbi:2-(acetamidomethylene)succinate hydrolase [Rhodobiaceae bacterium]|nr:2-(acetamidomethylene)succinate hydrolase [Rhodobiaceae bacterium]